MVDWVELFCFFCCILLKFSSGSIDENLSSCCSRCSIGSVGSSNTRRSANTTSSLLQIQKMSVESTLTFAKYYLRHGKKPCMYHQPQSWVPRHFWSPQQTCISIIIESIGRWSWVLSSSYPCDNRCMPRTFQDPKNILSHNQLMLIPRNLQRTPCDNASQDRKSRNGRDIPNHIYKWKHNQHPEP